jgi:ribosomal protein S27E
VTWLAWLRHLLTGSVRGLTPSAAGVSAPTPPSVTIGESVVISRHIQQHILDRERCPLCETESTVVARAALIQIECGACGKYRLSPEAASALDALVTYRTPGLIAVREMLSRYGERQPGVVPTIRLHNVISGATTLYVTTE